MSDLDQVTRERARLAILAELARQLNASLVSDLIRAHLRVDIGVDKSLPWVHTELDYLAELGAVTITEAGRYRIATLTDLGERHLRRAVALEGVARPPLLGG